jgi:flotillin
MDLSQMVGAGIGLGLFGLAVLLAFVKHYMVICEPNEVVVISGGGKHTGAAGPSGYRVIKGGRGFVWPIIESVRRLSLSNMPIEIRIIKALSRGLIPMSIDGRANVKIAGTPEAGLHNAIERFLGKSATEVASVARETVEGCLRGVIATVTPEQANTDRVQLEKEIEEKARADLRHFGLVLDLFKIQNTSDEQGYLAAIGRQRNAEVQRAARIAEATTEAEARTVAAEQKQRGRVAEVAAEMKIVEVENKLAVHQADLEADSNRARERSRIAGETARAQEERRLEEARVAVNQMKYQADVVVPAEAECKALELKAQGDSAKILENGKATAEAIRLMQGHWQEGKTRELFMIQMLPDLVDKVTRVVSENLNVEKLTVIDSGNGTALPSYVKNVTNSALVILEQLRNTTGVDIPSLLQGASGNHDHAARLPRELPRDSAGS